MKTPQSVIGYEFTPHGRGEIVFLSLAIHVYEVKDALAEYQEALARSRGNTDYLRRQFEAVESRRGALSVPWGKPGQYLNRNSYDEAHVEFKWQASPRIESWYGARVETLSLARGSVALFEKLTSRLRKHGAFEGFSDKPRPEDVLAVLKELKAVTAVRCEFETGGHFWLPGPEAPVPECPFKRAEELV
jgi:hypothetical protein